jgi:uncharacterized protein
MDITPRHEEGMIRIESYGARGVTINGVLYDAAVMICGDQVAAYPELSVHALHDPATYAPFIKAHTTSILLVGTGADHHLISPQIRHTLKEAHGIILDVMNTGAACRTFNVLRSEGRAVDALLLPVRKP